MQEEDDFSFKPVVVAGDVEHGNVDAVGRGSCLQKEDRNPSIGIQKSSVVSTLNWKSE